MGNGVDNDRTPFYPASYDVRSVIAVAASDGEDRLAGFSNYGDQSVDLLAPGVGIRSTVPGGGYQSANGTSMASPHVAGTAALIWSALSEATVDEVREALLSTDSVDPVPEAPDLVSTGGRLNAGKAINANVFAPSARVIAKETITRSGGTSTEFTVEYSHRDKIDVSSLGNDDLIVTRQWGAADQFPARYKPGSAIPSEDAETITAIYIVEITRWHVGRVDFGDYLISTIAGSVVTGSGDDSIEARHVGSFSVHIDDDPSVIYVNTFTDSLESMSFLDAIIEANGAGAPRTIILDSGNFVIDIPVAADPMSTFPNATTEFCGATDPTTMWSDQDSGDFDITGTINIVGNHANLTDFIHMR